MCIRDREQRNPAIRFQRIDADVTDTIKEEVAEEEKEEFKKTSDSLIEIFRKELENEDVYKRQSYNRCQWNQKV